MKLTAFFLLLGLLNVHATGVSQTVSISGKNLSLEKIGTEVEKQTGYLVIFPKKLNTLVGAVSVDAKEVELTRFLNQTLKGLSLKYVISNKSIFISEKRKEVSAEYGFVPASSVMLISGLIVDGGTKLPLTGAAVAVKGTTNSTVTDEKGRFSIKATEKDVLVISYIGYKTLYKTVGNAQAITIEMEQELTELGEVGVVSTGYEMLPKERSTGAANVVTSKELQKTPSINLLDGLEGKAPGVTVDLRNNRINIRGVNTYSSNGSQPLIVIDGFPVIEESNNDQIIAKSASTTSTGFAILSRFNPNDIESVTFLKDAAAASIWGSRAANGVIVVETKKGRGQQPSINFRTTLGLSQPGDLNKLKTMNSAQYIDLEQELFTKGFITDPAIWTTGYYTFNTNANVSQALEWMFKGKRGEISASERDAQLNKLSAVDNKGQIRDYLLQKAMSQQYNLSVSGASENSNYYLSGSMTNDRPVFRNNNARSYNLTANNNNYLFNKKVQLSISLNYNNNISKVNTAASEALGSSIKGLNPYDLLVNEDGTTSQKYLLFRQDVIDSFTRLGYLPWTYNAVDELNSSLSTLKENRFRINAALSGKVTNWLTASIATSIQKNIAETIFDDDITSYNSRTLINRFTTASGGKLTYNYPYGGTRNITNYTGNSFSLRGQLTAQKNWGSIHQLNALAGAEIRQVDGRTNSLYLYGFDKETFTSKAVSPGTYYPTIYPWTEPITSTAPNSYSESQKRYLSYFANAAYTFLEKYSASASVRFDDYSMVGFDRSKRAIPLWSAGLKWNIQKETFMDRVRWIDGLDLRMTLGTGGSIPTSGTNYTVISTPSTDGNTGRPVTTISTPANEQLGWETTRTFNTGIDIKLLKNRISVVADYYVKRSYNILWTLPFNGTTGWSSITFNTATLSSHGYEMGIRALAVQKKNFSWNTVLNFSYNTNKVTDARLAKTTTTSIVTSTTPMEGYSLNSLFVYRWAGLDNTGQSQIYDKDGKIVLSTTGNGNLSAADTKYVGVKTAPYSGGWFNDFTYKGFNLNIQTTYYLGHHFLKSSVQNYPTYTGIYSGVIGTQEDLAYRWKKPGDEAFTNVPGLSGITTNSLNRYRYSDALVRSASHVRLQQVAVSYSLPENMLTRLPFKGVSLQATVRNLGILWRANKDGIDPDYVTLNNYANLPPVRSYLLGLNVTF